MLPARHYESEHTQFIRELLAQKPQLVDGPAQGPRDLVGQDARAARPAPPHDGRRPRAAEGLRLRQRVGAPLRATRGARSRGLAPRDAVDEVARRVRDRRRRQPQRRERARPARRGSRNTFTMRSVRPSSSLRSDDARVRRRHRVIARGRRRARAPSRSRTRRRPARRAAATVDQNASKRASGTCDSQKLMNTRS